MSSFLVISSVAGSFITALLMGGWLYWSVRVSDRLVVSNVASQQMSWVDASLYCKTLPDKEWRLPSMNELFGLHYGRRHGLIANTDFWSDSLILERGFGLNTRLGWFSFDHISDDDHVICVRRP